MNFLILKLNVKDFDENVDIKNIKNYEKNMSLSNYNDFIKIKNDKCLSDVDYNAKYETNNIKNDNDDLFIMSFSNSY